MLIKLLLTSFLLLFSACNKGDPSKSQHAYPVHKTTQKNIGPGDQGHGTKGPADQGRGTKGPVDQGQGTKGPVDQVQGTKGPVDQGHGGHGKANQRNCDASKTMEKCVDPCIWMPVSELCSSKPSANVIKTGLASNAPAIYVKIG